MYSYLELENKSFEDFYLKFCGMQECKPNYSYGPAVRPISPHIYPASYPDRDLNF